MYVNIIYLSSDILAAFFVDAAAGTTEQHPIASPWAGVASNFLALPTPDRAAVLDLSQGVGPGRGVKLTLHRRCCCPSRPTTPQVLL